MATCATVATQPAAQACFQEAARRASAGEPMERLLDALAPLLLAGEHEVLSAGWQGGRLEEVLRSVLARRDLWAAARRRIRSGLVLPLAVLAVAALVAPLPAFIASGRLDSYLLQALLPLGLAWLLWKGGALLWGMRARSALRVGPQGAPAAPDFLDRLLLILPLLRALERNRNVGDCAMLLAQLIGAGLLLSRALEICARTLPNGLYRADLWLSAQRVRGGRSLFEALPTGERWPREFAAAVAVGEKAGALDAACARLGGQAHERYTAAVEEFGRWLPRFLYALVALYVIVQIAILVLEIGGYYRGL